LVLISFCIHLEYYLWKFTTTSYFIEKIWSFTKFLIKITYFVGKNQCFSYIRRGKKFLDDFSDNLKTVANLSDARETLLAYTRGVILVHWIYTEG
jgi:hypothetical protein